VSEMSKISRRDFLKIITRSLLAGSGVLGLGMFARFLGYQEEPRQQTEYDLGPVEDYPLGSRTLLEHIPALLVHTEAGFSAMHLVCTHLGCSLEKDVDGFSCPCHGSQFGDDGQVLRGPATRRLSGLSIKLNEMNHVVIYIE